jgi:hypothetical protein
MRLQIVVDAEIPVGRDCVCGTRSPACDSDFPPPRRGRLRVDQEIHWRLPHVKIGLECAQVIESFGRGTLSYRPLAPEIGRAA